MYRRLKRLNLRMLSIAGVLLLTIGCSTGGLDGVNVGDDVQRLTGGTDSHALWGLWQFAADPENKTLEYYELRTSGMHVNVLPFLEPPPLLNLTLEYLEFDGNLVDAHIGLRHPFIGLVEFTGFDVCGILISNGSVTGFTDPDIRMAGEGDLRLLNPDGFTRWWNPSEFPHDGTMFGYVDGLLGAPDSYAHYNSTLNGYKYYCDDLEVNDDISVVDPMGRGMFTPGQKIIRRFHIDLGDEGLIFNYAIDACWEFPQGDFPWVAPDDFSPNANRPEPYRLSISEIDKTLFYDPEEQMAEGEVTLLIDVYDWFDADLNTIKVECGDIFTPLTTDTPIGGGVGYSTYQVDILDAQPPAATPIELFITAACADVGYQGLLPDKQVASYFTYIMDIPEGEIEPQFPCGELFKEENFDSYSNGQYPLPAPWYIFWSGYPDGCRVTNEQAYSPPYSWRASDYPYWARYDGLPMTKQDHFCYEARIMLTNIQNRAIIGFAWKKSSSTTGHFCAYVLTGADYIPFEWYHVYAEIDCIENSWQLWVDDELKVDSNWIDETNENSFIHFIIGSTNHPTLPGNAVIYFDDIKFWVDQ